MNAIKAGRMVPFILLALKLARVLEASLETLFHLDVSHLKINLSIYRETYQQSVSRRLVRRPSAEKQPVSELFEFRGNRAALRRRAVCAYPARRVGYAPNSAAGTTPTPSRRR